MVVLQCSHLIVCNLDQHIVLYPIHTLQMHAHMLLPLLDCRAFLKMFHGTLFQNMEQVLLFIEYSHSACLKLNDWKKRSISKLGTDRECLNVVLSEVLVFSCTTVAVLHNMQSCML